jgi:hypothetical protein
MRLVPNQEWEHITELFKTFQEYRPDSVTQKLLHITEVRLCDPIDSIGYKANMAYTETFGVPAIPVRSEEVFLL